MRFLHFLVISLCLVGVTGSIAGAETVSGTPSAQDFSPYESILLEKLNWARSHPVEAVTAVGIDSNQLLLDSEQWRSIVTGGGTALQSNEMLQLSARQHTQDMVANRYYGYISPEGQTSEERIRQAGYVATASGEMLGLIAFKNFMTPEIAVQSLYEQLLKRDLRQLDTGKTNIFNRSLQDAGIAMMAGVSRIGNATVNAYLLTCDFGASSTTRLGYPDAEFLFLDMINQVRMAPIQAFEKYGIDMTLLSDLPPALIEILTDRLPPLVYSPSLREVALKRNAIAFVDPSSFEDNQPNVLPYDSCTEPGMDCSAVTGEIVMRVKDSQGLLPPAVVKNMFRELLLRELSATDISQLWILSPNVQEIGMILEYRQRESVGLIESHYVLANAYGRDDRSKIEKQSLNLLNQARAVYAPASMESGSDGVSEGWHPIPPLVPNHTVYAAADAHARDMVKMGYFDTYSYDGTTDSSFRLAAAGYPAIASDETIELITDETSFDPEATGISLFDDLLAARLQSDKDLTGLLSPVMKTAGIRFLYSAPVESDLLTEETSSFLQRVYSLLMVADVAAPPESFEAILIGLIFQDKNGDGRYDRDEELSAVPVIIRNGEAVFHFYSDTAGNVSVPLAAGTYEMEVEYNGVFLSKTVEIGFENTLLLFSF